MVAEDRYGDAGGQGLPGMAGKRGHAKVLEEIKGKHEGGGPLLSFRRSIPSPRPKERPALLRSEERGKEGSVPSVIEGEDCGNFPLPPFRQPGEDVVGCEGFLLEKVDVPSGRPSRAFRQGFLLAPNRGEGRNSAVALPSGGRGKEDDLPDPSVLYPHGDPLRRRGIGKGKEKGEKDKDKEDRLFHKNNRPDGMISVCRRERPEGTICAVLHLPPTPPL
ncbi:hypothetical protein MASR2M79_20320 [Aminivibrio sp.]